MRMNREKEFKMLIFFSRSPITVIRDVDVRVWERALERLELRHTELVVALGSTLYSVDVLLFSIPELDGWM